MRGHISFAVVCAFLAFAGAARADAQGTLTPEQQAELAKYQALAKSLHPQHGDVHLKGADVTLHLGDGYYFLPAEDAKRVLVDAWRNTPESVYDVTGMIFPDGMGFMDDSWAAVVTYKAEGYVPDSDAKDTDYGEMIKSAQDGEAEENEQRKSAGYEPVHLVGWAQPPYYDASHHTLVWAREIHFGSQQANTLNYDLRALGRRGVLSMNIVSSMPHLAEVRAQAGRLQNIGTFDKGARYQDYNADTDKTAEYGVAGLVAAGIGVVAAKKLGFLALALGFGKKFLALILAAFAGGAAWIRRLFTGKSTPPAASS